MASLMIQLTLELLSVRPTDESFEIAEANIKSIYLSIYLYVCIYFAIMKKYLKYK